MPSAKPPSCRRSVTNFARRLPPSAAISRPFSTADLDAQTSRRFLQTAQREAQRLTALIDALVRGRLTAANASCGSRVPAKRCDIAVQIRSVVETVDAAGSAAAHHPSHHPSVARDLRVWMPTSASMRSPISSKTRSNTVGAWHRCGVLVASTSETVSITVDDDGDGIAFAQREAQCADKHGARCSKPACAAKRGPKVAA